jgi:hypothetical protein
MGHLSATYNSVATLITRDFYLHWRPRAAQSAQVRCGRIAVLAVFALGALWAPVIGQFHSLWIYLQSVGAYLMMPFVGVFFLGVLWRRTTAPAVWVSVLSGFAVGSLLMIDQQRPFLPLLQTPVMRPWLHGAILEFGIVRRDTRLVRDRGQAGGIPPRPARLPRMARFGRLDHDDVVVLDALIRLIPDRSGAEAPTRRRRVRQRRARHGPPSGRRPGCGASSEASRRRQMRGERSGSL